MKVKAKQKDGKTVIKIKPSKEGSLHREMGIDQDKKIGSDALAAEKSKAKSSGDTALMKKVVFAQNFGGHNK
jgi:hypothetical protein